MTSDQQEQGDGFDRMIEDERQVIDNRLGRADTAGLSAAKKKEQYYAGICLSGGGIRSSTVSLGILQTLARAGILRHMDYISTVSGGGYIGSALALRYSQAARRHAKENKTDENADTAFPFSEDSEDLKFYKRFSSYLTPNGLSSAMIGFFIVARAMFLNLFIWLSTGSFTFLLFMEFFGTGDVAEGAEAPAHCGSRLQFRPFEEGHGGQLCDDLGIFEIFLFGATGIVLVMIVASIAFSVTSWRMTETGNLQDEVKKSLSSTFYVFVLAVFTFIFTLFHASEGFTMFPVLMEEPGFGADLSKSLAHGLILALMTVAAVVAASSGYVLLGVLPARRIFPALLIVLGLSLVIGPILVSASTEVPLAHSKWGKASVVVGLALAALAYMGKLTLPEKMKTLSYKYWRRRFSEWISGYALTFVIIFLVLGSIPVVAEMGWGPGRDMDGETKIDQARTASLSALSLYLFGAAMALFGFYRTNLKGVFGLGTSFLLVAGSVLFFYGTLIIAYGISITSAPHPIYLAIVAVAFLLSIFVNINDVALGRYYRDRLMEALMPDEDSRSDEKIWPATVADKFKMTDIVQTTANDRNGAGKKGIVSRVQKMLESSSAYGDIPERLLGPYPIINANLMTHWSTDPISHRRGGDNFIMSPANCGSDTTSWASSKRLQRGRLTVPTAMAISGAAASPGGGFAGTGVTTNIAVAMAMSLLSLRLGYWFRWHHGNTEIDKLREVMNPHGNHIFPIVAGFVQQILRIRCASPAFIELTDGGHFENLGLYELVRRRCGLIIVCDGGADTSSSYSSFTAAMNRIEEDFGAKIDMPFEVKQGARWRPSDPAGLVPRERDDEYPRGAAYAEKGYFLARIKYSDDKSPRRKVGSGPKMGLMIYLKSAMIRELGMKSRGYKGSNPEFPYDKTVDQFFTTEQFEAYRDVGKCIAEQMLKETDLRKMISDAGDRLPPLKLFGQSPNMRIKKSESWTP